MNAPSKETHRYGRDTSAALAATKAEALGEIRPDLRRTATRFARKISLVKSAATGAAKKTGLVSQILVDLNQLLEKLDIA